MQSNFIRTILSLSGLAALSLPVAGAQIDAVLEHLDRDGQFLLFMDHQGDAQRIGKALNSIQSALAQVVPQAGMIQLDFPGLFASLGVDNILASGFSSAYVGNGVHRNRSISLYEGEPRGLMRLIPPANHTFAVLDIASSNADLVYEINLDAKVLRTVANEIAFGLVGPMGAGLLEMQLQQPLSPMGPTAAQIMDLLSNHFMFIMEYPVDALLTADANPGFLLVAKEGDAIWDFALSFAQLAPEPITPGTDDEWQWFLAGPLMDEPESEVILARKLSGGAIYLASSRSFLTAALAGGTTLREHSEFKPFAAELPAQGNAFYFQSHRLSRINLMSALADEDTAGREFLQVLIPLLDGPLGKFMAGGVGAYHSVPNGSASVSFSNVSYKDAAYIVGATIPATLAVIGYLAIQNQGSDEDDWDDDEDDWGTWDD